MGLHAFTSEPEHCQRYRDLDAEVPLPQLVGYSERWNIPVAHHKRGLTESRFDGVNHYVLTYHIGGASVTKANWPRPNPASTGALSLEMPGHGGRYTSTGIVEYAHLYFRPSLVSEVADEVGVVPAEGPGDAFALSDDIAARDAQEYLRRASDPLDPAGAIEMDSRGYILILSLLKAIHRQAEAPFSAREPGRADMRRVLADIDERLSDQLRLSDLAALVNMSPFHFARVFRKEVGETPAAYLQRRRTERAVDLIRGTPMPLSEIAQIAGFSSHSHMTRRVKALTGSPPVKLRKP